MVEALFGTGTQKSFLSSEIVTKYFYYKKVQSVDVNVLVVANKTCSIKGALKLEVELRSVKLDWTFLVMDEMGCGCILVIDILKYTVAHVSFPEVYITFENLNGNNKQWSEM